MIIDKNIISKRVVEQTKSILERILNKDSTDLLNEEINKLYTPILLYLLGDEYKAIYWSPAYAPFSEDMQFPSFAKYGDWDLVDKKELSVYGDDTFDCFSKFFFIKFDITKTPRFPNEIKQQSYDLSFFNVDWAEHGLTYIASDIVLKQHGILMTQRNNLSSTHKFSNSDYSLIFDPEIGFPNYVLLEKQ